MAERKTSVNENSCPFCKISDSIPNPIDGNQKNEDQNQSNTPEHFFADDHLFVIKDIKPRAPHHYLIITRQHIESAKTLTRKDIDLVKRMVEVGAKVLKEQCKDTEVNLNEIRFGFHWPPLVLVKHLHMHVIYPGSEMSFFMRNVLFRPGFFFVTPDSLIERINEIPDSQQGTST